MVYFDQQIPNMETLRERRQFARAHPINLAASENSERAVDVRGHDIAGENYYHRKENNPPYHHRAPHSIPELYVREGVLARLAAVNERLRSHGYELYLFDAYRPIEVQNYFHDEWVPDYLRARHPDWSDEAIYDETGKYWAKGAPASHRVDPLSPPPHSTGAVVDLTLRKLGRDTPLFMGGDFDEVDSVSFIDHFEREGERRSLTLAEEEARYNRRLLYSAMQDGGFTGNPNEWWHYGKGDQLSAIISGAPHAVYSVLRV